MGLVLDPPIYLHYILSTIISLDGTIIKSLPLSLPDEEITAVDDCTGLSAVVHQYGHGGGGYQNPMSSAEKVWGCWGM